MFIGTLSIIVTLFSLVYHWILSRNFKTLPDELFSEHQDLIRSLYFFSHLLLEACIRFRHTYFHHSESKGCLRVNMFLCLSGPSTWNSHPLGQRHKEIKVIFKSAVKMNLFISRKGTISFVSLLNLFLIMFLICENSCLLFIVILNFLLLYYFWFLL